MVVNKSPLLYQSIRITIATGKLKKLTPVTSSVISDKEYSQVSIDRELIPGGYRIFLFSD